MLEISENLLFIETKGFSMWPYLRGKEKLIVKRIPILDLKLGDLVLYKAGSQLVCHRLVKKTKSNRGYIIHSKADTSFGWGETVDEQMFLGKAIGIIKENKITNLEGPRQRVTNIISLFFSPLFNFIMRLCYPILSKIK